MIGDIWAPNSDFSAKNNLTFRGRCYFNTIDAKNNANFYYDEQFGAATAGGIRATLVK